MKITISRRLRNIPMVCALLALSGIGGVGAQEGGLEAYLAEVKAQNRSLNAYLRTRESSRMQLRENDLTLSPEIYSTAQAGSDGKLAALGGSAYDRADTQNYKLGVTQNTRYGTSLNLSYAIDYVNYVDMAGAAPYYDATPVLEITQQLWRNRFGRGTRASLNATEAKWQAAAYSAEAGMTNILLDAEIAYWDLVISREIVKVQEKNLAQAEIIHAYVSDMAKKNLYEKADVIQAEASLESSRLDLKSAKDDERAAVRSFNALRNAAADVPAEGLEGIDAAALELVNVPNTHGSKAATRAAGFQAKYTAHQVETSIDGKEPSLAVYGSYALNGRDDTWADSLSDSYAAGRPTTVVGLTFSVPFNQNAVADIKSGLKKESEAADLKYQQAITEQDQEWADLTEKLTDARERLKMNKVIVRIQGEKLANERTRLRQGRTTTYQVLSFEKDHLQAELSYLRAAQTVLTLRAKLSVFNN